MKNFLKHFERLPDGSWTCKSFAEITTPMGRIQVTEGTHIMPGTRFMAFELCRLLDDIQEGMTRKAR
jgi:hypothetical protein